MKYMCDIKWLFTKFHLTNNKFYKIYCMKINWLIKGYCGYVMWDIIVKYG